MGQKGDIGRSSWHFYNMDTIFLAMHKLIFNKNKHARATKCEPVELGKNLILRRKTYCCSTTTVTLLLVGLKFRKKISLISQTTLFQLDSEKQAQRNNNR